MSPIRRTDVEVFDLGGPVRRKGHFNAGAGRQARNYGPLAVTRFSGRTAPPPKGVTPNAAPWVMAEAYSHEVSSCGFWPGNGGFGYAAFYVYAYPEQVGYGDRYRSAAVADAQP